MCDEDVGGGKCFIKLKLLEVSVWNIPSILLLRDLPLSWLHLHGPYLTPEPRLRRGASH